MSTCATWVFTVASLTKSRFAISAFESPRAISFSTSSSRGVSSASLGGSVRTRCRWAANELLDHAPGDGRRQQRVALGDRPDPVDELLGRDVLEEKPARADPERVVDVLVHVERRQHHDLQPRTVLGQELAGRLDPVDVGHADVHEDDVRSQAPRLRDRLPAVRGFADNFHVLFGIEDHAETRTDEGLIVDDEDAGAHAGTTGSFARRR